jgi:hypothetical protein
MSVQHLPDGARGKAQLVEAQQLALQSFGAELARAAEVKDQRLLFGSDFARRQMVRASAVRVQAYLTVFLVALPPLTQSRLRDAATSTGQIGVLRSLIHLHPAQARFKHGFGIKHGFTSPASRVTLVCNPHIKRKPSL